MRIADLGGSARLEYLTRIVPSLSTVVADGLVLEGEAGVAMAQWACKSLREAMRSMLGEKDAGAYLDLLKETLDRDAPEVVRQMPLADGQRAQRRSKKTAAAEGQLLSST